MSADEGNGLGAGMLAGCESSLIECAKCGELRPAENFYVQERLGKSHRHKTCRRCGTEQRAKRAKITTSRPGRRVSKQPERLTQDGMSGAERRAHWANFKREAGCHDCGERDWRVLEFDHLPQYEKNFTIGEAIRCTGTYTDAEIEAEVAKCDVVCRLCHLERTRHRLWAADRHTATPEGATSPDEPPDWSGAWRPDGPSGDDDEGEKR